MPIFRVQHNCFYTCISNAAIRDRRLTYGARGLHHDLLSNSDEWDITIKALAAINKEGRTAIAKYLNELKEFGYLEQEQSREKGSFAKSVYLVHELPEGTTVDFQDSKPMVTFPTPEEVAKALQSKQNTVSRKPDHGTVTVVSSADHGDTAYGSTDHGKPAPIEVTTVSSNKSEEVKKERSDFSGHPVRKDDFAQRANAASMGHHHRMPPQLIGSGLECVFKGPQPNMFDESLQSVVIDSLSKTSHYKDSPANLGDARKHIGKLIKALDWVTLQTYWDAAIEREMAASTTELQQMEVSTFNASEVINQELRRLDLTVHLSQEWQKRTKKRASLQLQGQDAIDYANFLRQFPDKTAYDAYLRSLEVVHAS